MTCNRLLTAGIALALAGASIVCASSSLAADSQAASTPPGLTPTSATLAAVIAAAKNAYGHPPQGDMALIEEWTSTTSSETIKASSVAIGADSTVTLMTNGMTEKYGEFGGRRWEQNENGITRILEGVHADTGISLDDYWRAVEDDGARLLGEVTSPGPAYVVETSTAQGRREWLFFDKSSALLHQAVVFRPSGSYTYTFTDYHTLRGVAEAGHIHGAADNGSSGFDTITTVRKYEPAAAYRSALTIPLTRSDLVVFPAGHDAAVLPARLMDGTYIVVRITINGRGLDFLLDTGASGIVLERGIADEMGLAKVGGTRREGKSEVQYHVVVPRLDIGDLRMNNVVIQSLPFELGREETTKVVGLIGYDFIAGTVLKIDYDHGAVTAYRQATFSPPTTTPIPVALDDQVPMVSGQLEGAPAKYLVLDTGANEVVVFSHFAIAHFLGTPDPKKNQFFDYYFPFFTDVEVGGIVRVAEYRAGSMELGDYRFGEVLTYVTWHVPAFERVLSDSDGIIGHSLLQYFDLYLDYAHERVYLVPNAAFKALGGK